MYESTSETKGYRGYIGSRRYAGGDFPQYVQNLLIRTYCQKQGITYLLSATEYAMPRCYMMLEEVVNGVSSVEGIVLFSIFMLPDSPAKRMRIYRKILAAGKSLHAALEGLVIQSEDNIQMIEDILNLNEITLDESKLRNFVENESAKVELACA